MNDSKLITFKTLNINDGTRLAALQATPCVLNSREWRGYESESLRLRQSRPDVVGKRQAELPAYFLITLEYHRPGVRIATTKPEIVWEGWKKTFIDKKPDGTLLDGKGNPLSDGSEPVWLKGNELTSFDFHDYDFGEEIRESNG